MSEVTAAFPTTATHWGTYRGEVRDGRLVALHPWVARTWPTSAATRSSAASQSTSTNGSGCRSRTPKSTRAARAGTSSRSTCCGPGRAAHASSSWARCARTRSRPLAPSGCRCGRAPTPPSCSASPHAGRGGAPRPRLPRPLLDRLRPLRGLPRGPRRRAAEGRGLGGRDHRPGRRADPRARPATWRRQRTMVTVSWSVQRADHGEQPYWLGDRARRDAGPDRPAGRRLRLRLRPP